MRFSAPWNLWFLILILLVIIMYMLKQRFDEREISSIFLWDQVLRDGEVNTPWQRLKRNVLLIVQCLAVLLLVLLLSNPLIIAGAGEAEDLIIVMDTTGSMNTKFEDTTRFEYARAKAVELIKTSPPSGRITLISCGRQPKVEFSTNDRDEAAGRLGLIKVTNTSGDINDSLSLIKAISKQENGTKVIVYTDSLFNIEGMDGGVVSLASKAENASVDDIAYSSQDGSLNVMVKVSNRGDSDIKRELCLYCDGKVADIAQVEAGPYSTRIVYFNKVPLNTKYMSAELTGKDALAEDNIIYKAVEQSEKKRALLFTDKNIFIEKTMNLFKDVEIFKTDSMDKVQDAFDLYIFDGKIPPKMPGTGSIILINPPVDNGIINVSGDVKGGVSQVQKHSLTKYMENAGFTVSILKKMETPGWGDVLVKVGEYPAVVTGEFNGRKVSIIGFDLHNTDFPLTPEFPIFMYNTIQYLISTGFSGQTSFMCGDAVNINPSPDASSMIFKTPSGKEEAALIKYPVTQFAGTGEAGIYTLMQKVQDKESISLFAVNFPCEDESKPDNSAISSQSKQSEGEGANYGTNIQLPIFIVLLAAMVIEWVVYIRGY